jgi:isoaspartyl peptidase/L-asparaginase-like protein (Ntn-hydrolase superfamily)
MVERDYFKSEERVRQWQQRAHDSAPRLDHESGGTVGAVARDRFGHLAAATSTGGMSGQLPGRVGDSAIIGAGTWAENGIAAISATGTGEAFMRCVFAKSLADEIKLNGHNAVAAARIAMAQIAAIGGRGGCIVMPASGAPVMFINSLDMLRAWSDSDGCIHTAIEKTNADS